MDFFFLLLFGGLSLPTWLVVHHVTRGEWLIDKIIPTMTYLIVNPQKNENKKKFGWHNWKQEQRNKVEKRFRNINFKQVGGNILCFQVLAKWIINHVSFGAYLLMTILDNRCLTTPSSFSQSYLFRLFFCFSSRNYSCIILMENLISYLILLTFVRR